MERLSQGVATVATVGIDGRTRIASPRRGHPVRLPLVKPLGPNPPPAHEDAVSTLRRKVRRLAQRISALKREREPAPA